MISVPYIGYIPGHVLVKSWTPEGKCQYKASKVEIDIVVSCCFFLSGMRSILDGSLSRCCPHYLLIDHQLVTGEITVQRSA